jgi:hypothetical protein
VQVESQKTGLPSQANWVVPGFNSLRNLSVLCVLAALLLLRQFNRRDAENAEVAQRNQLRRETSLGHYRKLRRIVVVGKTCVGDISQSGSFDPEILRIISTSVTFSANVSSVALCLLC